MKADCNLPRWFLAGHYLPADAITATARSDSVLSIALDLAGAGVSAGALRLEGRRGALMSNTLSVLIMPCVASAAEVCELEGVKGRWLLVKPKCESSQLYR